MPLSNAKLEPGKTYLLSARFREPYEALAPEPHRFSLPAEPE